MESNTLIIILTCLLLSAFFSGMEIAYISANKLRIELDRKNGRFSSKLIALFIKKPSKYLTTMLVGNNIALVIYGLIMARLLDKHVLYMLREYKVLHLLIQTIISTIFILVAAEFIPKMIFRNIANSSLNILALPILLFYIIFYPITYLINILTQLILRAIKTKDEYKQHNNNVFNKIDLAYFINQSNATEQIKEAQNDELRLFQNALDFSSVKLRDCMIPRTEISAMEIETTPKDLQNAFIETGFSKILIYKDSIDNIIGYITSKTLFESTSEIKDRIIEASFVPETMTANRLLKMLIQDKKSLAVVVDEFGGVSGMITIEDIMEEIFGEIEDEHDTIEYIEKSISDKEFIFSGRLEIDHINELYKLNIPTSEEYETLAGFIIHNFESIPKLNEKIVIEPFEIKTLKVSSTKIELIHFKIID